MSADTLEAVQRWMHEALVFPRRADGETVDRLFADSGRLSGAGGLAVYQRGYFLRIASCMREQFPALCHALGQPLFDDFVADYIRDQPPDSHTLYDLGRRFPGYLEETRPDRDAPEAWVDFMIDLARFERLVFTMFDAPGHEGKPFADPATPDERLRLQPAFALDAYRFAVPAYYHAVRRGELAELPPAQSCFAALVRTDYLTRTIAIEAAEYRFLQAMAEGSVEDGIAAAAAYLGVCPEEVRRSWHSETGSRRRWIELGFFIAG